MWLEGLLIIILLICVVTDLKSRKIYNVVIFPSLILAFVFHLILGGWPFFLDALLGFFIGLLILLIPYLLGGMGAGDVKLLALTGALKGTVFVLYTSVFMALIGALIAICILLIGKGVKQRLLAFLYTLAGIRSGIWIPMSMSKQSLKSTYPYGLAIAGGAFISLFLEGGFI